MLEQCSTHSWAAARRYEQRRTLAVVLSASRSRNATARSLRSGGGREYLISRNGRRKVLPALRTWIQVLALKALSQTVCGHRKRRQRSQSITPFALLSSLSTSHSDTRMSW